MAATAGRAADRSLGGMEGFGLVGSVGRPDARRGRVEGHALHLVGPHDHGARHRFRQDPQRDLPDPHYVAVAEARPLDLAAVDEDAVGGVGIADDQSVGPRLHHRVAA